MDKKQKAKIYIDGSNTYHAQKKLGWIKEEERLIYKANFDVEITADILLGLNSLDKVILFTGDSDFIYLVNIIKNQGKNIEFYSSKKTIAWEIRKKSKTKVNYLEDLESVIKADRSK